MAEEYFFFLDGETPSKKNSRITLKSRKTIPNKKYRNWNKSAMSELRKQWIAQNEHYQKPIEQCVIKIIFIHANKRRRDSDNAVSSIFDTLKDAGIIADDNWTVISEFHVRNEKGDKSICKIQIIPNL